MKNPYLADSSAEKNPEASREYEASQVHWIGYVIEQLMQDKIPFVAQYDNGKEKMWITLEGGLTPEECNNAFTRGENNAYYWLVEAPGRSAPFNSTDDYD